MFKITTTYAFLFLCKQNLDFIRCLERFKTAEMTSEVTQDHLFYCHSIGHMLFPVNFPS